MDLLRPTHAQRLILAGQRLDPGVPLYNQAFAFEIQGALEPERLSRAFSRLVAEADALRTAVVGDGAERDWRLAVQDAESAARDFTLPILDLGASIDPEDVAAEAYRPLNERAAQSFELGRRLFDAALLQLAADRWVLYLNQHHVVTDARSMMLLFGRLSELYQGLEGRPLPSSRKLPEHEQRCLAEPDPKAVEHWRQIADVAGRPVPLHAQRPRSSASRRLDVALGAERDGRLRELARRPETGALSLDLGLFNLLATLLIAFQYRLNGAGAQALGAPSHNRSAPELARLANLLIEVFPLDVRDIDGRTSFVELLGKVRTASLEFLRYAAFGTGDSGRNRGVQTVLNFIRGSFGDFAGLPVTTRWLHSGHHDRQHVLRLQVHDLDGRGELHLQLDLNRDVFGGDRAERTVDRFLRLMDALLDDWTRPIGSVPLMAPGRAETLAVGMAQASPGTGSVLDWIAEQAAEDPNGTALAYGPSAAPAGRQVSLTRGRLQQITESLARSIRSKNTGAFVGLHMGRGPAAIVAALAVMRSGAAYLPLDPAWPEARKRWLLQDAGARLVLEDAEVQKIGSLGGLDSRLAVCGLSPDFELPADGRTDETDRLPATALRSAAYLLYTSGSTGQPKGAVISHGALAHYVGWARDRYGVGQPTFPLFSPLTFDLTVTSVFVPLTSGGRVLIYPETDRQTDLALLDVARDDAVDVIKLTPSHLGLLENQTRGPRRVARLILGGEALTVDAARRALRMFGPHVVIHNEYGPTEAAVGCVEGTFDPDIHRSGAVPIGRSIAGSSAWVLDDFLNPVPVGVAGELYLAGPNLADGYGSRPALTAERFVPDPFQADGSRLYRTGDLARWRPVPGADERFELEFLGRNDDQVKIRGVRLELGEVEAALLEHGSVREALVGTMKRQVVAQGQLVHCRDCGLPSNFPGVDFDADGVCNHCRAFTSYQGRVDTYFRDLNDLRTVLDSRDSSADYDCVALLSGGKDSTYALCRLIDMGYRVLAFTLDNGYISDQAKDNIRRVVDALGVDHIFGTTPAMNEIFADSLRRYANVCQGCFKTLYTLSLKVAHERDIPFVVTGLSRGQLFETRLTPELFNELGLDPEQIDRTVLEARKAYHRTDDAVSRLLDVSHVQEEELFERVSFVDFYRYCDVELDEVFGYLAERVPWIRPTDTGRSTNCLINDLGIWVHRRERGFHNYALPYSWDVRLGHKTRDAALDELDDELDEAAVRRMMSEVGYESTVRADADDGDERLVAWYVADGDGPSPDGLRAFAAERLPAFLVPSRFQKLDSLPLTPNGKVDRRALESLESDNGADGDRTHGTYVAPETKLQKILAQIWAEHLGAAKVGLDDDFYKLGGDSILAIRIAAACHRQSLPLEPAELFDAPTVRGLAQTLESRAESPGLGGSMVPAQASEPGPIALVPSQLWCLDHLPDPSQPWNQILRLRVEGPPLGPERLEKALRALVDRHEALRLQIDAAGQRSRAELAEKGSVFFRTGDTSETSDIEAELHGAVQIEHSSRLAAGLIAGRELVLVGHHLSVDALSWPLLIQDLESLYDRPETPMPPASSWREWVNERLASSEDADEESFWRSRCETAEPVSQQDGPGSEPRALGFELDVDRTSTFLRRRSGGGGQALLIAAAAGTLADWSGRSRATVFTENHGRDDGSAVVGWLGHLFPVDVEGPDWLPQVEAALEETPRSGSGFGALRYLSPDSDLRRALGRLDQVPVLVNYLGRAETLVPHGRFRLNGPLDLHRGPGVRRPFGLEIDAWIIGERLNVRWTFAPSAAPGWMVEADLEARLDNFEGRLWELIDSPTEPRARDFPLAKLDAAKMNKLAALLGNRKP